MMFSRKGDAAQHDSDRLRWNRPSRMLLLAPSVALFLVLVVRLWAGADHFQGEPYCLDFGWKYGLLPHDRSVQDDGGDALYNEPAEKSVAFTVEFNSYGHCIQGVLAAFLAFPAVKRFVVDRAFCCGGTKLQDWTRNLVELAPWVMALYPTYSLVKRVAKARHAFAGSSFANNSFEWSAGFVLGLALGDVVTAASRRRAATADENGATAYRPASDGGKKQDEASSQLPPWWKVWESSDAKKEPNVEMEDQPPARWVRIVQSALGIVLVLTVLAGSVLFGTTWNGCLDGSPDVCVNAAEEDSTSYSTSMTTVFVTIPLVTMLGTGFLYETTRR